jgi:hypothetical protein
MRVPNFTAINNQTRITTEVKHDLAATIKGQPVAKVGGDLPGIAASCDGEPLSGFILSMTLPSCRRLAKTSNRG